MERERTMRVLGIETSCDETAAAVVTVSGHRRSVFAFTVRSNIVVSQVALHARTGGVVPEVAAREHVGAIMPTIEEACRRGGINPLPPRSGDGASRAGVTSAPHGIDAIAVTSGPGLLPSLSVGVETARALAFAWRMPLIAVNHIAGHVVSSLLAPVGGVSRFPRPDSRSQFPALALIVSGGHTELLHIRGWERYACVGATRDDAAGEAFDKVAKLLGLGYPGGPSVARMAEHGDPTAIAFPRGMITSKDFDFSFSGMKTAVRYLIEQSPSHISSPTFVQDVCASFQAAVVDVLVAKTVAAAKRHGVRTVLLGGGVAANRELRRHLGDAVRVLLPHTNFLIPDASFTGDNAAMVAAAGGVQLLLGERTPWQRLVVDANWELGRSGMAVRNPCVSRSEATTERIAVRLARTFHGGEIILLEGELGAGKTVFVRGLARGMGIHERIVSPTFVLLRVHRTGTGRRQSGIRTLVHVDAYRIRDPRELEAIGLLEWVGRPDTIVAIEWGGRVVPTLRGMPTIRVRIIHDRSSEERRIVIART